MNCPRIRTDALGFFAKSVASGIRGVSNPSGRVVPMGPIYHLTETTPTA